MIPVTLVLVPVLEFRHIAYLADYVAMTGLALVPPLFVCGLAALANLAAEKFIQH